MGAFIGAGLYKALFWPPNNPSNEDKEANPEQDVV